MNNIFEKFGGRKNINLLIAFVVGLILVFNDKISGEFFYGSIMAGFVGYAHYNVKQKEVAADNLIIKEEMIPTDSDIDSEKSVIKL